MSALAGDGGLAERHGRALLRSFGLECALDPLADHPALAWRRAGLMEVTGLPAGPGRIVPAPLTAAADGALAALRAIAPGGRLPANGPALLGERARLLGLRRQGATSANGTCRLLAAKDGLVALNLARADDWELLPALFGASTSSWADVERHMAVCGIDPVVQQGALLGLPITPSRTRRAPESPIRIDRFATAAPPVSGRPLVVDLSSLWAGPLAASLLAQAGAAVIKVESVQRPDGARGGNGPFFDLMNAGKHSVALDFACPADVDQLRNLVLAADIVIESSRPRALQQLGIDARQVARGGATWLSITAYGREGDAAQRVGFGDDAAVGGGLAACMATAWGAHLFAGDAIADPLTGITAALAGWAHWRSGGGGLVSLAMADVVEHAIALGEREAIDAASWQTMAEEDAAPLYPMREPVGHARPLGADNAVLGNLGAFLR